MEDEKEIPETKLIYLLPQFLYTPDYIIARVSITETSKSN